MIKGCNKRVIVLKDPHSDYFDEAYFILKERVALQKQTSSSETKMIDEANRIVADNLLMKYCNPPTAPKKIKHKFTPIAIFIMGMVTSSAIIALCKLLFS